MSFKEFTARGLGLIQTVAMFNPLHEADQTTFEKVATDIIESNNRNNAWLKTARKINGFTQEQLIQSGFISIMTSSQADEGN